MHSVEPSMGHMTNAQLACDAVIHIIVISDCGGAQKG